MTDYPPHNQALVISLLEETRDAVRDLTKTMTEYREDHVALKARVDSLDEDREQGQRTRQQLLIGGAGVLFTLAGSILTHLIEHLHR
jgi:hypothetical protein